MRAVLSGASAVVFFAVASSACTSTSPSAGPSLDASADATVVVDGGAVDDAGPCGEVPEGISPAAKCVERFSGTIEPLFNPDAGGAPPSTEPFAITLCSTICLTGTVEGSAFKFESPRYLDLASYTLHLVHPSFADVMWRLSESSEGVVTLTKPLRPVLLADPGQSLSPLTIGAEVGSGPVKLTFTSGTTLEFTDDSRTMFRSVELPEASWPDAVAGKVDRLFGLAPFANVESNKPIAVRVANDKGWDANAAVDFFVLDDDYYESADCGRMKKIADGKVSADGTSVETVASQGLLGFTWVGVKKK